MTAREVLEAFLTPPKWPELSREADLRATGRCTLLRLGASGFARGGGDEIAIYVWGDGPRILCVHGWGGRATNFAAFVNPLVAAGFRVVAFDAPGHGQSSGTLSSGPAFAAGILAVEAREGPFKAIVAHSLGALAATCAQGQGVKAERVVFLGACCWVEPLLVNFIEQLDLPAETTAELFQTSASEFGLEEISAETVAPRLTATAAMLMHDPDDSEMPYSHSVAISSAWPGAVLVPIRGVGHRRILRSRETISRTLEHLSTG